MLASPFGTRLRPPSDPCQTVRLGSQVGSLEARSSYWRVATPRVTNRCVAARLAEHQETVGKWRSRFIPKRCHSSVDTFKLSSDRLFIDKVRDIVGLYMCPSDHVVALCVDDKTQVQALARTRRSSRCCRACRNGRVTTTSATEPSTRMPPSTSQPARSPIT